MPRWLAVIFTGWLQSASLALVYNTHYQDTEHPNPKISTVHTSIIILIRPPTIQRPIPLLQLQPQPLRMIQSLLLIHIRYINRNSVLHLRHMPQLDIIIADLVHQVATLGCETGPVVHQLRRVHEQGA